MQKHPLSTLLLSILILCAPATTKAIAATSDNPAVAATPQTPKYMARQALVRDMANTVLSMLKDQKKPETDRASGLERGFANIVDTDWIAKFVLGNFWKSATEEQKEHFAQLYRSYLTKIYVAHYAESSDRKITAIKILGINDTDGDSFTARTEIELSTAENMKVDYMVNEREGGYKIIDVIIEGVSLLNTHRAEFSKIAANRGVDGAITELEHRVKDFQSAFVEPVKTAQNKHG